MILFWTFAALLIGVALLFLLPPLLRGRGERQGLTQQALNVAIYRNQLAELEADLRNGNLDATQFEQARHDLQRTLLESVGDNAAAAPAAGADTASGKGAALVVGIALPVAAVGLYLALGGGAAALDPGRMGAGQDHFGSVEDMVASLQQRLEANPENPAGWSMLARSHSVLGNHPQAAAAYEKALEFGAGEDPDVLAGYADVLAALQERRLQGRPMELLQRALQIDPNHVKSLWLVGTAAYQANDLSAAREYWTRLAALLPPGSEDAQIIQANLTELDQLVAGASSTAVQAAIQGVVELAPALAAQVEPTDIVFVSARAADDTRMPLMVLKRQAQELPFSFTLDETTAMIPGPKLSDFTEVEVTARISKSGDAMTQPGDLRSKPARIRTDAPDQVRLLIDEVVQ
ncbi:MAG: c-type cytochrome biogenesis protein CcmI [Gammaproteobacteria bacterium]